MINAVIFDMDGLLIDSEPAWTQAEIATLKRVGVTISQEQAATSRGLRTDEKIRFWRDQFNWSSDIADEALTEYLITTMVGILEKDTPKLPGVDELITLLDLRGIPMSIASSSPKRIIDAAISNLGFADKLAVIHSAEYEEYGKPHPAVFLATANKLGFAPESCIVFEDSLNGVIAAKAAKMQCIAVPEIGKHNDQRFSIADATLTSLLQFDEAALSTW